jgi:protein-disulfide isomerase
MKRNLKKVLLGTLGLAGVVIMSGCQGIADKYVDSYFERKGPEIIEKTIDKIVAKKREEARRQEEPSLSDRLKNRANVSIENAPVKGAANAPITIVEFSDHECPFCSRVLPTVDEIMKNYNGKVKLAFRHNPLPFHPRAMPAAKAAVAAQRQGKFWEMSTLMFKNQQALTDDNFKKWAKELKLDLKKFEKDMKDPAVQKMIEEDSNFARSNGAGGTPSFFINGVLLVGAQPAEKFKEVIEALLAENTKK